MRSALRPFLQLVLCARSSVFGFFEVICQFAWEVSLPFELHAEDARLAAAGPRDVTLYTRPGCHLCEEAKAAIAPLVGEFGAALREVNIDDDAVLRERYGWEVPVIFLGGRKVAKHRVNVEQFRRQLRDVGERR
jgi:glutaredoxin